MRLLYTKVSCLVKVAGECIWPIEVQRGISEGCPLSGLLYTLAIEPFILSVKSKSVESKFSNIMKVSAYADYVIVVVRDQRDLPAMEKCIPSLPWQSSSARVNWETSEE